MLQQHSIWPEWLKILMQNPLWGYMRGVNLGIWIALVAILLFIAGILLHRSRGGDIIPSQMWLFRSFALFFIFTACTYLSYMLAYNLEPFYNLFLTLGYTFGIISVIPIIATIEKYILIRTRHVITIFTIILFGIALFVVINPTYSPILRVITQSSAPILGFVVLILYLIVIKNSTGSLRQKAMMTLIGFILIMVGMALDSESIMKAGFPLIISPLVLFGGALLVVWSQKRG
jgi:hypothetical protein